MPGRQSHGRAPSKKPKVKANSTVKKRSQDAYAIALAENPDKIKIRQSRLGASEGGNRPGKRARDEEEDDEDEEEATSKKQRKSAPKGRFDELDVDEGSDSEGNEWKLGQVDSDDDSELDSDEAFGESDEERFEGFTFAGSSDKKSKKKRRSNRDVNLDEDDDEESDSELEEGDLGEDAIDLAAMLDATAEDDAMEAAGNAQTSGSEDEGDSADESEDSDSDDESEISSADSDDMSESAAVQNLIADLPQGDTSTKRNRKSENSAPTGSGLPAIDMAAMNLLDELKGKSKRKAGKEVMDVPLARRQQDRLDRSAAYEATKQTLARWTDTVKHNRRADHLIFPLPDQDTISAQNNSRLQPVQMSKPLDGLEATIQTILEESGQAPRDGKDDEDRLRQFEELAEKKMSVEEVKANRARLRMARELMFREEAKSKRIKKIKSKSYRKVHRKQREKEERLEKEALAEGGFEPSEDEQEAQDRRRAAERMGAKHRGSKWAKQMKATGRTAWDEEVRTGTTEMARLDEELRKRKDGRSVRKDDDDSETSSSESEQDDDEDEEAAEQRHILRQLNKVGGSELVDESLPGARLSNMKFMRNADAARKKENDAMVEDIRRQLAGEVTSSEEEDQDIGRRIFGPGSKKAQEPKSSAASKPNEFEEPSPSDEEDHVELEVRGVDNGPKDTLSKPKTQKPKGSAHSLERPLSKAKPEATSGGAWSKVVSKSDAISNAEAKRRRHKSNNAVDVELDLSEAAVIADQFKPKKPVKKTSTALDIGSDEDSDDDNASGLPFAIRDVELIKRAFAGDDVVTDFEAEKKQTIRDEDEKIVDNTLPGWGSWAGDGLSKREQKRGQKKDLTKVAGIKEKDRKDSKLKGVIINQSRIKKNVKYMASALPHQFETRQQYERSLRLPVGPEWTTKETFQDATKPRILLKQGIIAPMSKPLL